MTTVNMLEAKTNLSKLIQSVENGAEKEIVIARNGKPVARIVPLDAARPKRRLGLARGKYPDFTLEEFNATDGEIARMFYESPLLPDEPVVDVESGSKAPRKKRA
jgi:prevent-host-death family protein